MEVTGLNTIRIAVLALLVAVVVMADAVAGVIIVPDHHPTIRQAIQSARSGDIIQLRAGRYQEAHLELRDGVTIMGDPTNPNNHVIDAGGQGRAFRAEGISGAQLVGLTVTGGNAVGPGSYSASGGGVFISRSTVTLQRVVFLENRAEASGGGVRAAYSDVQLIDCVFRDCRAAKGGGAIDLSYDCTATALRTIFENNRAAWGGAISARTGSSCLIEHCDFIGNSTLPPQELGGAFFADHAARVTFRHCLLTGNSARQGGAARLADAVSGFGNCTIDRNTAWEDGAGFMVRGGSLVLDHSIVSFNDGEAVSMDSGNVWVSSSDIHGNSGGDWSGPLADMLDQSGNFDADPAYCNTENYRIAADSPCAGNENRGLVGAREVGCDLVSVDLLAFDAEVVGSRVAIAWTIGNTNLHLFRLTGRAPEDTSLPAWTIHHEPAPRQGGFVASDKPAPAAFPVLYRLESRTDSGEWFILGEELVDRPQAAANDLTIQSVFPNPFNPRVTISLSLKRDASVRVSIFDITGRRVRTLHHGVLDAGCHDMVWSGKDDHGHALPTGTYLLRIEGDGLVETRKLLLVK